MSTFARLLIAASAALLPLLPLHAETYVIKKIVSPSGTICINKQDLRQGDKFSDGAVIYWKHGSEAMRVLSSKNEPITISAAGVAKPARMRTIIAGLGTLSTRAVPTSLADHRQIFEGVNGKPHALLDTISIASSWRKDDDNYFEMSIPLPKGKRIVRLPSTSSGQVIIARDMFPLTPEESAEGTDLQVEIAYTSKRAGQTVTVTSAMPIRILPLAPEE